jgi:hypothetical protein
MKQRYTLYIFLACVSLYACKKSSVKPTVTDVPIVSKPVIGSIGVNGTDTLTSVTGYISVQFAKDSINTDNTVIEFSPTAKPIYVRGEDAPYLPGFGVLSLSTLSSDNVPLAINELPITLPGITVNLKISAKTDGLYHLNMQNVSSLPNGFDVWLRDNYKKDSLDFREFSTYAFNIYNADATTFGSKRFQVVIRKKK